MPLRWLVLIPAISLIALAQTPAAQISGHVFRADTGEPLAKAIVSLFPPQENLGDQRIVRTTADGAFAFTGLLAGTYSVSAERNGFVFQFGGGDFNTRSLSVRAGQELTQITLRLIPAGLISGTVIDEDRDPVARLTVTALRTNYLRGGTRSWSFGAQATTDDQGNFRLAGLRPGSYFLRTGGLMQYPREALPLKQSPERRVQYRQTYYPDTALSEVAQPLRIEPGTEIVNVRISLLTTPAYTINGRIESGANATVKPGEVTVIRNVPVHETFNLRSYLVQPDGSFTIPELEPGEYVLTAQSVQDGRQIQQGYAKVQIVDANLQTKIRTGAGPEVRGRVIFEGGELSRGWQVALDAEHSWNRYPSSLDLNGAFDIRDLPPGTYLFNLNPPRLGSGSIYLKDVQCPGAVYTAQVVNLEVSSLIDKCEITLASDGGAATGVVKDDDKPVPGVIAVLIPRARDLRRIPRFTTTATTGADGAWQIRGVIPGDYYLLAAPATDDHAYFAIDYADIHRDIALPVTIKAGDTQSVTLTRSR
jgi:hypothetical protein